MGLFGFGKKEKAQPETVQTKAVPANGADQGGMAEKEEKKVEYLELIYDLIFVYLIGRNNLLLHHLSGGFVPARVFLAYILCTLAVIQIWSFSTFYMNLYGRNSVRDHVFLFINMYLLYHMADGISEAWQSSVDQFCIAWILILVNLGVQHLIEMRNHTDSAAVLVQLRQKALVLFTEAVLVAVNLAVYHRTGVIIAYVPIFFGILVMLRAGRSDRLADVDFGHLTERTMLYIVFTFGEMIISISAYFSGTITVRSLYFSLMAFLIIAALFLCYEIFYNKIIDRSLQTDGTGYMLIHVCMIVALNNISVSLEFMREEEVAVLPKVLFLSISLIVYFVFLFLTGLYAKKKRRFRRQFVYILLAAAVTFLALMIVLRNNMAVNIAITVIYVYGIFLFLYFKEKEPETGER